MALLNFARKKDTDTISPHLEAFLQGYSIEVMPRTAEKIDDFRYLLPKGTRVYVAHIEGTPIDDMVATAKRIKGEGYDVIVYSEKRWPFFEVSTTFDTVADQKDYTLAATKTVYEGQWGTWRGWSKEVAYPQYFVSGVEMRYEDDSGDGDETAGNGIRVRTTADGFGGIYNADSVTDTI